MKDCITITPAVKEALAPIFEEIAGRYTDYGSYRDDDEGSVQWDGRVLTLSGACRADVSDSGFITVRTPKRTVLVTLSPSAYVAIRPQE
jgi:hypothetical protein